MTKDRLEFDDSMEPSVEELLERYAQKPVRGFLIVDVLGLDEQGARVNCYSGYELRNSDLPVRVYVAEDTKQGEALYCLAQVIRALKEDWNH